MIIKRTSIRIAAIIGAATIAAQAHAQSPAAVGGAYIAVPAADGPMTSAGVIAPADPQYRAMFQNWKRLEQAQQGVVAVPSLMPIETVSFTSGFGVRSDPFRGGATMHAGVDMPGAIGTAIYATADGLVGRAGWHGGYGNLVEVNHGKGIQTRYGHLSQLLVAPGSRVTRGQLIGRLGSPGRSPGSHLHYEVRFDGHAINPMPFMQTSNYLMAMTRRQGGAQLAMGGPANAGAAVNAGGAQ